MWSRHRSAHISVSHHTAVIVTSRCNKITKLKTCVRRFAPSALFLANFRQRTDHGGGLMSRFRAANPAFFAESLLLGAGGPLTLLVNRWSVLIGMRLIRAARLLADRSDNIGSSKKQKRTVPKSPTQTARNFTQHQSQSNELTFGCLRRNRLRTGHPTIFFKAGRPSARFPSNGPPSCAAVAQWLRLGLAYRQLAG
jgi:hypothetical protein